MIDQRDFFKADSVDGIRERWADRLARTNHKRARRGDPPLAIVADDAVLVAYVNHGRWVADCLECGAGIFCWPANPQGCCLDCFHVYEVSFPGEVEAIEAALEPRRPPNRNWLPAETVDDLHAQNTLMLGTVRTVS